MYTVYYDKEAFEIKFIEEQLAKSSFKFEFLPVGDGKHKIPNVRDESLIFYFLKKNGILPASFASKLKRKYPLSIVGCICAGDCFYTKEMALAAGADFFLASTYPDFLKLIEKNIQYTANGPARLKSHNIKRESFGLSPDQLLTLRYLASGMLEKEISELLGISEEAVTNIKTIIKEVLNLNNHSELVRWVSLNIHPIELINGNDPLLKPTE